MTMLNKLPPEIIDYIASLCDPSVIARDVPIDDLKNLALVSRVFTPIAQRRLFWSVSFLFHYEEASGYTPEREIFLGIGHEAVETAKSPCLCHLVRAVNFRQPIYPALLDESMVIPAYNLRACLRLLTNVRSITLFRVAINPNTFSAVAEIASREGSSLHIHQCRIIPGTPLPFLQRPFRLQEFTLSRNSSEREMSEDYCVDILGRALLRCSATTLQKVELRLRQPQFQDLLDGMHLPNLSSLLIEHLTTPKLSSDLSCVTRFLCHHPTIQQLGFHGHSTLEIPSSSISSPRLRLIRSNSAVLQKVRTACPTLRSLWVDIFDKIDWYDTEVFNEVLPRCFLGLRHLVFLGSPLSGDPLNCISTAALLPYVIGHLGNIQSIYLSLDNKEMEDVVKQLGLLKSLRSLILRFGGRNAGCPPRACLTRCVTVLSWSCIDLELITIIETRVHFTKRLWVVDEDSSRTSDRARGQWQQELYLPFSIWEKGFAIEFERQCI